MTRDKTWFVWLRVHGVCVVSLLLLSAISVSAQISNGTILGVVKDATGGAVAGAAVTVTNTDTALVRTGTTGEDGAYRFPALPVGHYEVQVMKEGFQVADRKGITLEVAQEAAIDVTLQVGSTGQTVTVTEEAPQVDTTSSSLGGQVQEQEVQDLPLNGRNYVNLTLMQSGVTQSVLTYAGTISPLGVTGTTYSSNGAPLRSNLQTLDGAIMSNVIGLNATSVIGTTLGVDGIKEYKVTTSMYSAEYGLVIGGQTTMVSKGGSNQWHGDVFDYLRNSAMDARNYFDALDTTNHNGFGTDKSLTFPDKRIPPFARNQFGGSFGGPIKKDKTFFYGVYEGLRLSQGPTIDTTNSFNKGCFYGSNTAGGANVLNNKIPEYIDNIPSGPGANPYSIYIGSTNTACTTPAFASGVQTNPGIVVGCPLASITGGGTGCAAGAILPNILTIADSYFPLPNVPYGTNAAGNPAQTLAFNYTFPFKEPQNESYAQLRMDQIFNANDSAFFRYTADLSNQISNQAYPQFVDHYKSQGLLATVGETHVLSPTLLNTARVSYSRSGLNYLDLVDPSLNNIDLIPGQSTGCCSVGNNVTGTPAGITPGDIYQNIFTVSDDVFWTKGKHAFKFGTLLNHYTDLLDLQFSTRGSMSFANNTTFFDGNWSSVGYTPAIEGYGLYRVYNYNTLGFYAQDDYRVLPRVTLNLGLRYEIMTDPTAPPGLSYTVPNPEVSTQGVPDPPFLNPSLHSFSPRLGFAWDVFGDGKTSLRGGVGIYYDIGNTGNLFASNATGGPPLSVPKSFSITGTAPPAGIPAGFGSGVGGFPLLSPAFLTESSPTVLVNLRTIQYQLKQPSMGQWNLTLDRQLPWGMAVTVAYVGNSAWHQTQLIEGNPTVPASIGANGLPIYGCYPSETYGFTLGTTPQITGGCGAASLANIQVGPKTNQNCTVNTGSFGGTPNLVPGPCWGTALISSNGGNTTYNALQLGLNKRLSHGLQLQVNYTWAHAMDDCVKTILDVDSTSSCEAPQYLFDDKGSSYNDVRHNIRANVLYHIPDIKSDAFYAKPLHGWWIGSITSWQTGYPITITNGVGRDLAGNVDTVDRPNLDPSYNASTGVTGNPRQWFNPTMFDLQPVGTIGNSGRAVFRGPRLADEDFSINKDTKLKWLGEQGLLQFRAEIFNILNHPNFAPPGGALTLASPLPATTNYTLPSGQYGTGALAINNQTVGALTRTVTTSRQVQVALKVVF